MAATFCESRAGAVNFEGKALRLLARASRAISAVDAPKTSLSFRSSTRQIVTDKTLNVSEISFTATGAHRVVIEYARHALRKEEPYFAKIMLRPLEVAAYETLDLLPKPLGQQQNSQAGNSQKDEEGLGSETSRAP